MLARPCRATNGLPALDDFRPLHPALWRRWWRSHAALRRAVPDHGVRAIDLSRESARHRGLPVGASLTESSSSGVTLSWSRQREMKIPSAGSSGSKRWHVAVNMPRNDSGIEVSATLYCSSINNVQRQARFRKRDDLTAKYSNDNSMIKANGTYFGLFA